MISKKIYTYYKKIVLATALILVMPAFITIKAQQSPVNQDTITNPKVDYSSPRKYEIAGITVTGAESYDDYVVIGFSGLSVGEIIKIPGDEITDAVKRFWKQKEY